MSFDITFDYRFDSSGFFDDPDRRAALEAAATIWEDLIGDEFADVPAGTVFSIDNPSDSGNRVTVTLDTAIDDLLIFVGAENLSGPLGLGGYDGVDADGDVFDRRIDNNFRGEVVSDFEPWVGTMTFDTDANWNFDLDGPAPGTSDFLSVTLHEIAHILGIGTSPIFKQIGASGSFTGVNTVALNGGNPVPLQAGLGHVAEGFDNDTVLLDPLLTVGTRTLPGRFDLSLLADIGYQIDGYVAQGSQPAITTEGDDITVFGTILGDLFDGLGGRDQIQGDAGDDTIDGGAGNDTLFGGDDDDDLTGGDGDDQLQGGAGNDTLRDGAGEDRMFGQGGVDTFVITAGGGTVTVSDFDLAAETFVLEGSGFASADAAVAAITKPFSNVSQLTFDDGTSLRVFHTSQSGTPLTADHFELGDGRRLLSGDDGANTLTGDGGDERLDGLAGNDTLDGGAGADIIDGGAGRDTWQASGTGAVDVDLGAGTARDGFGDMDELISIEDATGGAGNDRLVGSDQANTLDGGAGRDTMEGGAGDDTYRVDDRSDRIVEALGGGSDTVLATGEVTLGSAEIERVVLEGSRGLRVNGNGFDTEIVGNSGSNILIGGGGDDTVTGGGGQDFFAFLTSDAPGTTRITDFGGADQLALDDRFFGLGDGGIDVRAVTQAQINNAVRSGAVEYNFRTGEMWIDGDGRGGPGAAQLIAVIEGGGAIGVDDVLLF